MVAGTADRVLVMYAGREVELANVDDIFYNPRHPYTRGLLASLPRVDGTRLARLHRIEGQPPSLIAMPSGCAFHPRCTTPSCRRRAATRRPELRCVEPRHRSACHFAEAAAGDEHAPTSPPPTPRKRARSTPDLVVTDTPPILEVTDLVKEFPIRGGLLQREVATVSAVAGVSFSVAGRDARASWASRAAASRRPAASCSA